MITEEICIFFTNKNGWENVLQEVEENLKLYLKKEESSN